MAEFDPFESGGAVAVDEPAPRQSDFDPFEQGARDFPVRDEFGIGEEVRGLGWGLNRGGRRFVQSLDVTAMRQSEPPEELKPAKSLADAQRDYETASADLKRLFQADRAGELPAGTVNFNEKDAEVSRLGMEVVKARHADFLKKRAGKASVSFGKQAAAIEKIPETEAQREFAKEETPWWHFFKNPVELASVTLAESAPVMATTMAAAPLGPLGVAGAAGVGSWNAESAGRVVNAMSQAGVDLKNPKEVMAWFADRRKSDPEIARADLAALGPATFDALTAGLAGKFLGPALGKGLRPVLTATGKEMGLQMAGGGIGSIAGSVLAEEPIDWKDFVLEVAGEFAPGEAVSNVRAERARRAPISRLTTQPTREQPDAIPQQISATLPFGETPPNRPPLVEEVRQPEEPARAQVQTPVAPAPAQVAPIINLAPIDNSVIVAKELGFTVEPAMNMEGVPPEVAAKIPQMVRLTDKRAPTESPTAGLSFSVPANASREQIEAEFARARQGYTPPVIPPSPVKPSEPGAAVGAPTALAVGEQAPPLAPVPIVPAREETKPAAPVATPTPATPVAETSREMKPIGSFVADGKDSTGTWIKQTVTVLSIGEPVKLSRPSSDGGWQVSFDVPSTLGKTGRQTRTRNFFKKAEAMAWIDEVQRGKPTLAATPPPSPVVAEKATEKPAKAMSQDTALKLAAQRKAEGKSQLATARELSEAGLNDGDATGIAAQVFSEAAPAAKAVAKVESEIKSVAATEGQRSAKEIKAELVQRLEKALEDAPSNTEFDSTRGTPTTDRANKADSTVTIKIPGDGEFTPLNRKENIADILAQAKRISTTAGTPPKPGTSKAIGNLSDQADAAARAYGSAENAYRSTKRQRDESQSQGPPTNSEDRKIWNDQIESADALLRELYGKTKAGTLEVQAEAARDRVATYKEGAKGFESEIARLEAIKRKNFAHTERLADLKERYAQNQDFIKTNERNAASWEQQSAKEKAALESTPTEPTPPETGDASLTESTEGNIAERAIAGIEDLQKKLRGTGSDVSMGVPKAILDLALEVARLSLKAGNTIYQAIDAAIAKIREQMGDTAFDEAQAREAVRHELEPTSEENGSTIDPATGERIPNSEGDTEIVQIAGLEYNIIAKERLTPEQKAAANTRAQEYFKELGLPGEADTSYGKQRGAIDTNIVFKIEADGENHDDAGEALLKHLTEQIQSQHQPGGDPAYVSSLVNAVNKNFNVGNFNGVFSDGMIQRLMEISVGESSWRGTMLRAITGITEDMGTVARNARFFLRRTYENMFGGDLVRKVMDRIALNFRERFTGEEIERLYNENPILQELFLKVISRLKVKPSLRDVIAEIFATRIDRQDDIVEKFVDTMVNKFSATPSEAERLKAEFSRTFAKSFEIARQKAQAKALSALLPAERKVIGEQTPLWKKLTDLVNSGWFDSAKVVEEYARSRGMKIPTEDELDRMRKWSIREQALREPTLMEIEASDNATATARAAAVTLEKRQDLLRLMNTQWSRWTHPTINRKTFLSDIRDPVKRYNSAMAANEWLTANLLLKLGFGSRQVIDVGTQMVLHTPTRAAAYAFEQWSNDKSAGRDTNLLHDLSQAMSDAYRTRIKVLRDTLASFKRTLAGKGEQKNVEQLLSSIAVFDRMLLRADEMKAAGRPAAARFLTMLALTMRFGRQFAAAADVIQGVPAEAQEMAHQIRTGLREQGKGQSQQDLEFNTILGLLTTARTESLTEARQMLERRGLDTGNSSVQRAAWHILREKVYAAAKTAGLPADEWKKQNHYYRNVIGWNEPESQGLGRGKLGGPGGFVATTAKAGKELSASIGIPAFPFVFGNAMGIALNRKLAYSPLGLFPGIFKGSPWFEGERNIRQRKIEAVIGTTIGSTLFTLAALGLWVVLPRKWPDDDKERARWTANGWAPGMLIVPVTDTYEQKISTRVGPMALLSPYLSAGGAFRDALTEQAKKQAVLDERAKKLGLKAEQLEGLDPAQWLSIVAAAGWASAAGGRTASGMLGSYTDFGNFSAKKSGASATSTLIPGLPGYQEISRMAGANINPKTASFWDLLVPLPTSDANRVNLLGDPMRNENDVERIFQVLTGGTAPFPRQSAEAVNKTKAYANLFASDYRPPAIVPSRGYQFGNEFRPMKEAELQRYTTARGVNFAKELQGIDVTGMSPEAAKAAAKAAFDRANAAALESVSAVRPAPVTQQRATAPSYLERQRQDPRAVGAAMWRSSRAPTGRRASLGRSRTRRASLRSYPTRGRSRIRTTRLARIGRSRVRRARIYASRVRRPRITLA